MNFVLQDHLREFVMVYLDDIFVFLQIRVDAERTRPDPDKVEVILKQSRPNIITKVWAFLEAAGFFKKYIQDFRKIVTLLYHITSNKVSSCWIEEIEAA